MLVYIPTQSDAYCTTYTVVFGEYIVFSAYIYKNKKLYYNVDNDIEVNFNIKDTVIVGDRVHIYMPRKLFNGSTHYLNNDDQWQKYITLGKNIKNDISLTKFRKNIELKTPSCGVKALIKENNDSNKTLELKEICNDNIPLKKEISDSDKNGKIQYVANHVPFTEKMQCVVKHVNSTEKLDKEFDIEDCYDSNLDFSEIVCGQCIKSDYFDLNKLNDCVRNVGTINKEIDNIISQIVASNTIEFLV